MSVLNERITFEGSLSAHSILKAYAFNRKMIVVQSECHSGLPETLRLNVGATACPRPMRQPPQPTFQLHSMLNKMKMNFRFAHRARTSRRPYKSNVIFKKKRSEIFPTAFLSNLSS